MLIALPPSEGKTAPTSGPALDLESLAVPEFTDLRAALVHELEQVSKQRDAREILGVGPTAEREVAAQRQLGSLPCGKAHEVYTGVLYRAADFGGLTTEGMERARDSVLIFSALFGATSVTDLIPQYRLTMGVKLPGGAPRSRWRPLWHHLDERADGALVIDGRSSAYAGWKPPATATRVTVGAVRETAGTRTVVTHNAKYYRGILTRLALRAETPPRSAEDLAQLGVLLDDPAIADIELAHHDDHLTLTVVERGEDGR